MGCGYTGPVAVGKKTKVPSAGAGAVQKEMLSAVRHIKIVACVGCGYCPTFQLKINLWLTFYSMLILQNRRKKVFLFAMENIFSFLNCFCRMH